MIQLIISILLLFATPEPQVVERRLEPIPEPSPIYGVFLPGIMNEYNETQGNVRTVYGVGSPHSRTYNNIPYYNWAPTAWQCETSATYMPMLRTNKPATMPEVCNDGRWILVENEPELARISPVTTAKLVNAISQSWAGRIACCNVFYGDIHGVMGGLNWMKAFYTSYEILYNNIPPIDAVAIHIYEYREVDQNRLREWRSFADLHGLKLFVTEAGTFPSEMYSPPEVAARLPVFLGIVDDVLDPDMLLWFSDYIQPWALPDGTAWHHFNLTELDKSLTVVGEAYEKYTNLFWR